MTITLEIDDKSFKVHNLKEVDTEVLRQIARACNAIVFLREHAPVIDQWSKFFADLDKVA